MSLLWSNLAHADHFMMPPQASEFASHVDSLYSFLVWASLISCILVIGGMVYFVVKYKRRADTDKTAYIAHNATLEFLWSFIPFVIFMIVFGWGWKVFHDMRTMPENAFEVHVVGQQWSWNFVYKSGRMSPSEMYVPIGEPVKLIISSRDVIHSVYIPAFRVKQDAVPGRYTALHFTPTKLGEFQMFCAEYCGTSHSGMLAKVKVVSKAEFDEWLSNDPYKGLSPLEVGKVAFQKFQCFTCHSTAEVRMTGPGLGKVFGSQVDLEDGSKVTADENYVRESILNSNAKIVKSFANNGKSPMPTFQGQMTEDQIAGLIEYIKSLK